MADLVSSAAMRPLLLGGSLKPQLDTARQRLLAPEHCTGSPPQPHHRRRHRHAEEAFDIGAITERFETLLRSAGWELT